MRDSRTSEAPPFGRTIGETQPSYQLRTSTSPGTPPAERLAVLPKRVVPLGLPPHILPRAGVDSWRVPPGNCASADLPVPAPKPGRPRRQPSPSPAAPGPVPGDRGSVPGGVRSRPWRPGFRPCPALSPPPARGGSVPAERSSVRQGYGRSEQAGLCRRLIASARTSPARSRP